MTVIVTRGEVKYNGRVYGIGETITGMGKNEERRLAELQVASLVEAEQEEEPKQENAMPEEEAEDYLHVPDVAQHSVREIQEIVAGINDTEALEAMQQMEEEQEIPRKTAIAAIAERIKELR